MIRRLFFLPFLFVATAVALHAQVTMNVMIKKPTPTQLTDWRRDPSIVRVMIVNASPVTHQNAIVSITVRDLNKNKVIARTKDDSPAMPRFTIPAMQTKTVAGPDIIHRDAFDLDESIKRNALTTDAFPEGDYEFCIRLLAEDRRTEIATTPACPIFSVVIPDPPMLIKPVNEMSLPTTSLPQFVWTPVAPTTHGARIMYRVKIVPMYAGQNGRFAIDHNDVVFEKNIATTMYQYLPSDKQFSRFAGAISFAWQVQALDVSQSTRGIPAARNDGKSEIGIFAFKQSNPGTAPLALMLLDPTENQKLMTTAPVFSVGINKKVNRAGIAGGTLSIWEKKPNESDVVAMKQAPVFTHTFSGNSESDMPLSPGNQPANETQFDLGFVNRPGSQKQFTAKWVTNYIWKFTLQYTPELTGGNGNGVNQLVSNVGSFNTGTQMNNVQGDCTGPCVFDAPVNSYILATPLAPNDQIKIGAFTMTITSLTNTSNSSLTGEGVIPVPVFKAGIIVSFNGLKVNTDKEVFSGKAQAVILPTITIPQANNLGAKIGLNPQKLQEIQQLVGMAGRLVSGFAGLQPINLPIGLDNLIPGVGERITIAIIGAEFSPTHAGFNAAMDFPMPFLGPDSRLGFGANDVCLHPGGLGMSNVPTTLYLIEDFGYNQNSNSTFAIELKAPLGNNPGTYVSFNCEGFQSLHINGEVNYPTDWIVPVPNNGQRVKMNLDADVQKEKVKNWMFMVTTNTAFAPASMPDFIINCQNMYLDFSDLENPPNIAFPEPYAGPKKDQIEWHGFYMPLLSMTLPNSLKTQGNPITININDFIIDGTGFTVAVNGHNIVQYPQGDFGDWGASIDSIKFSFVSSSFQNGSMDGKIQMPISDDPLLYHALLSKANTSLGFMFTVTPKSDISVPLWVATMNIDNTSVFQINAGNGQGFKADITLNGDLSINGSVGGYPLANFLAMKFQNLKLMSYAPYFTLGNFSLASPQHGFAGFPITLDSLRGVMQMDMGGSKLGLQLAMGLLLSPGAGNDDGTKIEGHTVFTIWGKYDLVTRKCSFAGADLNQITLNVDAGAACHIAGTLNFYKEHQKWGNGFYGAVDATFLKEINVQATVQFGSKPKNGGGRFTYWYVDAQAILPPPGIPFCQALALRGVGIGAWRHMKATLPQGGLPQQQGNNANASGPGMSNSGISYDPDESVDFGIKAKGIIATMPKDNVFNGDIELGLEFINGGFGTLLINGKGYMLTGIYDRDKPRIFCGLAIEYNSPQKTLHANLSMVVDMPPFISGDGQCVLHVDPNDWYLYIGTPIDPIDITIASLLNSKSYFMVGSKLEPVGNLPPEIWSHLSSDLKEVFADYARNNAIGLVRDQGGVAFGSSASFGGSYSFGPFYASLKAGFGFDIGLRDYGDLKCNGSNEVIGIDGWYLNGQAYAFLEGKLGIHLDILLASGDFDIIEIAAGAALKAQLPNPTWAAGVVYGEYDILGGLISGSCEFEFEVGEQCKLPVSNPLDEIKLISDFRPEGTDADVFSMPQAAFSFPVNKAFDLDASDQNGDPIVRTFRVQITDFKLFDLKHNKAVQGNWGVNVSGFTSAFVPEGWLEGESKHRALITATAQERIGGVNGAWNQAKYSANAKNGKANQNIVETDEREFTTGKRPNNIPQVNMLYTYPLTRQRYYLQNELKTGGLYLRQSQNELFSYSRPGFVSKYLFRFTPVNAGSQTPSIDVPVAQPNGTQITFTIPTLQNSTVYEVTLLRRDSALVANTTSGLVASNDLNAIKNMATSKTSTKTLFSASDKTVAGSNTATDTASTSKQYAAGQNLNASTVNIKTSKLLANLISSGESKLFTFHFRTSEHNTLAQKLNSLNTATVKKIVDGKAVTINPRYTVDEPFDEYDVAAISYHDGNNTKYLEPLIRVKSDEQTRPWHTNFAKPEIYEPIEKIKAKNTKSGAFNNAFAAVKGKTWFKFYKDFATLTAIDAATTSTKGKLTNAECTQKKQVHGGNNPKGYQFDAGQQQQYNPPQQQFGQNITRTFSVMYRHGVAGWQDYQRLHSCIEAYFSTSVWIQDDDLKDGYQKPVESNIEQEGDIELNDATFDWLLSMRPKTYKKIQSGSYPLHVDYRWKNASYSKLDANFTYQAQ